MKHVDLYTDGACSGNPGPGGYGAILVYNGKEKELSEGFSETTNNRMEILGVISGLKALKEPCEVTVYSDSKYVVDAIEKGCREFASDCELDNEVSLKFHLKVGFAEANRIICFTKQL